MNARGFIAAALLAACASPSLAAHKGKIDNWEDPQAGMAKANAKGLPMMMFFTADW